MPTDPQQDLRSRQIAWTGRYHGYHRLAGSVPELGRVIRLLDEARAEEGRIPEWVGIDLLRGAAFLMMRADHHGGGYGLVVGGTMEESFLEVLRAVAAHPACRPSERPPLEVRPQRPAAPVATGPRQHRDPGFLAAQLARVDEPHVAPLSALARRTAAQRPGSAVPLPDPCSGGVAARTLLLHDSPTRAAGSTGMLSLDADTGTASAAWVASTQKTVSRMAHLHWPAVPWVVERATVRDLSESRAWLQETLALLEDLRVVIPLGPVAAEALAQAAPDLAERDIRVRSARRPDEPAHDDRWTGFAAIHPETLRFAAYD